MDPSKKSWRKNDDGEMIHDGDCRVWGFGLCTCGLLHHLLPQIDSAPEAYAGDFWADHAKHDSIIEVLLRMPKMNLRESTPEEIAAMGRAFEEIGFRLSDSEEDDAS